MEVEQVIVNAVSNFYNQVGSNYCLPSFVGVSQGQQVWSHLGVNTDAAQSILKLMHSLSKNLSSTMLSSAIMCIFGIGFMKDSYSLLSVAEVGLCLLHWFVTRSQCTVVAERENRPSSTEHAKFCSIRGENYFLRSLPGLERLLGLLFTLRSYCASMQGSKLFTFWLEFFSLQTHTGFSQVANAMLILKSLLF